MMTYITAISLIVIAYPFNKIVRFVLGKVGVPRNLLPWIAFIALAVFQLLNLSTRLGEGSLIFSYAIMAMPALIFYLVIDLLRNTPDSKVIKFLQNRIFKWITAVLLFIPLISTSANIIRNATGFHDVYYLASLVVTIIYLSIYLYRPKKQVNQSLTPNNVL